MLVKRRKKSSTPALLREYVQAFHAYLILQKYLQAHGKSGAQIPPPPVPAEVKRVTQKALRFLNTLK